MAKMSLDETKKFLDEVLQNPTDKTVRKALHDNLRAGLKNAGFTEPQFYEALLEYQNSPEMGLKNNSEKVFLLLSRLPSKKLREDDGYHKALLKKLSPNQIEQLPGPTLGSYPTLAKILNKG